MSSIWNGRHMPEAIETIGQPRQRAAELPALLIDRGSPMPLYAQLADVLEQEIVSGRWESAVRIPSEQELCEHFDLSRTPVRQALARLEHRGLIGRRRGQGSFVRSSESSLGLLQASEGFFQDEIDRRGRTVTSRAIRAMETKLPARACDALGLDLGSFGALLERLRSIEGEVALYVVNYLPPRLAPSALSIVNPNESLYRRLRVQTGVEPAGGRRKLSAVAAEERVAELLELPVGAPVAFIESITWDADLQPFDYYEAWLRTDRVQVDIYSTGAAAAAGLPLRAGSGGAP